MFTAVLSDVPGYESSQEMMSAHIFNRHKRLSERYWVTFAILNLFLCVLKVG